MEPQTRYVQSADGTTIAATTLGSGPPYIASQISGLSAPGEVSEADIVRGSARTSAGVTFEDRGEHALNGVADPVRVYSVSGREG